MKQIWGRAEGAQPSGGEIAPIEYDVLVFEDWQHLGTWRFENLPQALGGAIGAMKAFWTVPDEDIEIVTPTRGMEWRVQDGAHPQAHREGHMVTIRRVDV
jgi:hypothetical protein